MKPRICERGVFQESSLCFIFYLEVIQRAFSAAPQVVKSTQHENFQLKTESNIKDRRCVVSLQRQRKSKIPVYCCSSQSSSPGSVNSTKITNSASLISQPGFSFVKCNFAVDFLVSIQCLCVEQKQKKRQLLKCH